MKRFYIFLLLGIAGCGPAFAQPGVSPASVSPALGLMDFRIPLACSGANVCATVSPAFGATGYWLPDEIRQDNGAAARRARLLLPGPAPRPEPATKA